MEQLKIKALSDDDIIKALDGKVNVLKYSELYDYDNIDDAMKDDALVILYEASKDNGHWCCLTKKGNTLRFADPYGVFPDDELDWLKNTSFKKMSKQDFPYLSYLMYKSPYKLEFNEHKFQKLGNGINTCGRWCILFCALKDLPLSKLKKLFKNQDMDSDLLATALTYNV